MASVENTTPPPAPMQPPLEPVTFNTAIFDRQNNGATHQQQQQQPLESRERQALTLHIDPKDRDAIESSPVDTSSSMRHDPFSSTAPTTPPIYSPPIVNHSPYFFPSQTPGSSTSTTTTLHPQSRTLSIQSLISVSTNATGESSVDDDEERKPTTTTTTTTTMDGTESVGGVSIEDPDVRMAAEALGDLRADFIHSPPSAPMSPPTNGMAPSSPTTSRNPAAAAAAAAKAAENEPLLNLIGVAHPYIGQAVAAGRNVYRGGKRYSPRFRYGAEMVERAAGPMSSVVSFAAQRTGVEGVLRRRLEARSQNATPMGPPATPASNTTSPKSKANGSTTSMEAQAAAGAKVKKRRKATKQGDENMEVDEVTSVADEEEEEQSLPHKHNELVEVKKTVVATENWQRRLMLSTAGAGVALSEESLKSLKFCLEWLRWANVHLDKVIVALRNVLDEWDQHNYLASPPTSPTAVVATNGNSAEEQQTQIQLQKRIDSLRGEVLVTLKKVVEVVSTYAGGALPENARVVVKACITNLPRRWALVAASASAQNSRAQTPVPNGHPNGSGDENGPPTPKQSTALTVATRRSSVASLSNPEIDNNRRVLLLAKEGLDMLHQVSSIVEGTLIRAEEWCDRLGRRKPSISSYGAVGWDKGDVEMKDSTPSANGGAPAAASAVDAKGDKAT